MRVTVASESDAITLVSEHGDSGDGWLLARGLDGWLGTPAPKQDAVGLPGLDGGAMPSLLTAQTRVVTVRAATRAASPVSLAALRSRLLAMACRPLTLTVEDAAGPRSAACYMSDDPEPDLWPSEDGMTWQMVLTCPDPRRYGPWASFPVSGGSATVENPGDAATLPRVVCAGPVTALTASWGGRSVTWEGAAGDGLDLDLSTMAPARGRVVVDDAFALPPGRSTVAVSATGATSVSVLARGCWR